MALEFDIKKISFLLCFGLCFRCKTENIIGFGLVWFNSNLERICFIELSSELDTLILDVSKKNNIS